MPIQVVIADDHQVFRLGLRTTLELSRDVELIGEAQNGEELLNLLHYKTPDVVLLDVNMPKLDGFKALQHISQLNRTTNKYIRVIILSVHEAESYIIKAIEEGACGYLNKMAAPTEILLAIEKVYETGVYFNDKTNKALQNKLSKPHAPHANPDTKNVTLTKTEKAVLQLLCNQLTSAQIAQQLFIGKRTVEDVRSQLYKKTGTKNAVGLALWANNNNIK